MNILNDEERLLLKLLEQALFGRENEIDKEALKETRLEILQEEAKMNAVFSLIYPILQSKGFSTVNYDNLFFQRLANNIRVAHEHSELHHMFLSNDISYVILKGCASAMYYSEPLLRSMGDVDFLVPESELKKVDCLLKKVKFEALEGDMHEYHTTYQRKQNGMCSVWETHWSPSGIPQGKVGEKVKKYLENVIDTANPCTIQGVDCLVPSSFHHGLIMLLHTATHLINAGVGLRHLCDWAVFVDAFSDEEFKMMFEKKLKDIGMWKFAQILTQLCIKYLGVSNKEWCSVSGEEYLERLMCDICKGGNFGVKDKNRINQAKLLTNSKTASVEERNLLVQFVETMNERTRFFLPITKRMPVLLPIGWLYVGGRHLARIKKGIRPKINVNHMIKGAAERREIYKEFQLFAEEKGD